MEGFGKGLCPKCHGQFHFPLEAQGVPASCPRCQHVFVLVPIVDSPTVAEASISPQQTQPALPGKFLSSPPVIALLRTVIGGWMVRILAAGVLLLIVGFALSRSNPPYFGKSDEEARFKKMLRDNRAQLQESADGTGEVTVKADWPEMGRNAYGEVSATFLKGRLQTAIITQAFSGGPSFRANLESSFLLAGIACGAVTTTLKMTEKEVTDLQSWYLKPVTSGELTKIGSEIVQSASFGPVDCRSRWGLIESGPNSTPVPRLLADLRFSRR